MEQYNDLQLVKRRFYALRNGVTAESLRNARLDYRYIFGLNLPQLAEIASELGMNKELALKLRDDTLCRESQLLAPMLFPPEELSVEAALEWIERVTTPEAVDILCHRLLRKIPGAWTVVEQAMESAVALTRYAAARLAFNLLYTSPDRARRVAETMAGDHEPAVARISGQMLDELEFLKD